MRPTPAQVEKLHEGLIEAYSLGACTSDMYTLLDQIIDFLGGDTIEEGDLHGKQVPGQRPLSNARRHSLGSHQKSKTGTHSNAGRIRRILHTRNFKGGQSRTHR
jgi:hypothetical protein